MAGIPGCRRRVPPPQAVHMHRHRVLVGEVGDGTHLLRRVDRAYVGGLRDADREWPGPRALRPYASWASRSGVSLPSGPGTVGSLMPTRSGAPVDAAHLGCEGRVVLGGFVLAELGACVESAGGHAEADGVFGAAPGAGFVVARFPTMSLVRSPTVRGRSTRSQRSRIRPGRNGQPRPDARSSTPSPTRGVPHRRRLVARPGDRRRPAPARRW